MWISNNAEVITRLFVIAMNTPIEFDIYGHVNLTHVDGSKVINGLIEDGARICMYIRTDTVSRQLGGGSKGKSRSRPPAGTSGQSDIP
jgi:hypothetical protein